VGGAYHPRVNGDATLVLIRLFAVFVAVSVAVSLIARRIALPHAVVLVGCGLGAGLFVRLSEAEIPPELVLLVLIPGLIFEASYKIDSRILRRSLPAIVLLAGPGVFVTGAVVALVLHAAAGMSLATGFVVGAIVSATDPAAVIAIFRHIRAPRRLSTLVEAESVFNDGTGIVVFSIQPPRSSVRFHSAMQRSSSSRSSSSVCSSASSADSSGRV
jgi:Na+:H+ antiporter